MDDNNPKETKDAESFSSLKNDERSYEQEGIVPDIYDIDVSTINQSVYENRYSNRKVKH